MVRYITVFYSFSQKVVIQTAVNSKQIDYLATMIIKPQFMCADYWSLRSHLNAYETNETHLMSLKIA